MQPFAITLRVRRYEVDVLGHVNNAVYQHYLEQAAVEHSEQLGFSYERYRQIGGIFVLRRITIDYLRPALAGDLLRVTTWIGQMRGPRAVRHYQIHRAPEQELLLTAEALWAWIDLATGRPRPIPAELLQAFLAADGSPELPPAER
ncbi:acyl-CoA thioesterase [Kallotenue papyrolyticum]|uniref:acyl-CoA thioesterase n=1 Tax=Kallotenue papyrolyticum TaxID=1325125 RepID=UPI0004785695|nr:thioesterase family protein [Kallotenue papyrolyticum]